MPGRLYYRQRRLQLNPAEKTELIWFGGRANLQRFQAMDITIRLGHVDIEPADYCVRDLRVLLDSSLSLHQHIARVTSTCFFIFDGSASSAAYSTSTPDSDLSALQY